MRKLFIAGNWKMNTTREEAVKLTRAVKEKIAAGDEVDVGVCPPFTYLEAVVEAASGSPIIIGAQNVYFETKGAFTGEISPLMLKDIGCQRVIIGHSERRHILKETDEVVNRKVKASLEAELFPILCVGELLEEREAGKTRDVVKRHLQEGMKGVSQSNALRVVIAYEPVWAIGTGKTATPEQAQEVHAFIRALLEEMYGAGTAESMVIQYGGSVKPENALELLKQKDIDGALVGGASLKVESFAGIIDAARSANALKGN